MRSGTPPGLPLPPLPEPCSGDHDRPVADASDDIDEATEGLNVPADGVHLGDLAAFEADEGTARLADLAVVLIPAS